MGKHGGTGIAITGETDRHTQRDRGDIKMTNMRVVCDETERTEKTEEAAANQLKCHIAVIAYFPLSLILLLVTVRREERKDSSSSSSTTHRHTHGKTGRHCLQTDRDSSC